jgi:hypothetical protein
MTIFHRDALDRRRFFGHGAVIVRLPASLTERSGWVATRELRTAFSGAI